MLEDIRQHVERRVLRTRVFLIVEARFREFDVPVAELIPDELVNHAAGLAELELVEARRDIACRARVAREDPAVSERVVAFLGPIRLVKAFEVHEHVARCIPDLVREVARALNALPIEAHIVARRVARNEHEAQRIRAVLLDDLDRVDAVAERLRHLAALAVAHEAVDEDVVERDVLAEREAHHDHAGDPEEDDVVARDECRRRVEMLELRRLVRPAERLERPEARAEPRIEHVLVLMDVLAMAMRALREVRAADARLAAVVAVPRRDAVAPPELARNAPVADVLKPVDVDFREALRHELDAAVLDGFDGRFRERFHLDEPLLRDERLDRRMAARAMADSVLMVFDRDERTGFLEFLDERLAAFVAVHAFVFACTLEHLARIADDLDGLEMMALSHLEIVRIMRWRDFDGARAERLVDILVGEQRDAAANDRQDQRLADEILVALVIRVHGNARVAEHRLGARRRDFDVFARLALDFIADMPEMACFRHMVDLDVRDGRVARRAPVRDARALIDQALLIERDEHFAHGTRAALVHREALAIPVERRAERTQLEHDAAAELFLPVPDALEELLAAELVTVRALFAQSPLDLRLRRDARMVAARNPDRVVALHAVIADQDVLQRVVERMAHV